jgi:hypothetical protein
MGLPGGPSYRELAVPWGPGDRVLLYTDGLSEARDADGTFLAPSALGPALSGPGVAAAMDAVLETVGSHTPGARLADDLALLLLEHMGAGGPDSDDGAPTAAAVAGRHAPAPGPRRRTDPTPYDGERTADSSPEPNTTTAAV